MWLTIIVVAVIIGAILGASGSNSKGSDALAGAFAGFIMAASFLVRLAIFGLMIFGGLWLFAQIFC